MIRILKSAIRHPIAFAMTLIWPDETRSDPERWVKSESLFPEWDERTALLAKWIENGSSVIEFGAARLTLPKYLGPDCSYQPVDMVRRSPECLVFNLNGELPDLPRDYDVAVFSGVIEYVNSPGRVLDWLAPRVKQVVCCNRRLVSRSYNSSPQRVDRPDRCPIPKAVHRSRICPDRRTSVAGPEAV